MIINTIELNNFRIYRGRNKLDLTTSEGKNIVIISGSNGFGKTTFLMSLVWCLYGRQMGSVDELYASEISEKKSYGNYISGCMNDVAREKGETKFSVSLTFSHFTEEESALLKCKVLQIVRTYDLSMGQDKVDIYRDGKYAFEWDDLTKEESAKEKEHFIRDRVLALEVAKFFFFDAERVVAFANTTGSEQSTMLSNSFTQALGIQRYAELREKLERVKDDYKKESADKDESNEYLQIETQINTTDSNQNKLNTEKKKLEQDNKAYLEDIETIQSEIIREGKVISDEELQQLRDEETKHRETMDTTQEELKNLFNILPLGMCGGLLAELIEQVQQEKEYKQYQFSTENIKERTDELLGELNESLYEQHVRPEYQVRRFYEDQITSLIRKYFSASDKEEDFKDFCVLHDLNDNQLKELYNLVHKVKNCRTAFVSLYHRYSEAHSNALNIRKKIAEAEQNGETELLKKLRGRKKELQQQYDSAVERIAEIKQLLKKLVEDHKALCQKKEALGKKIKVSEKNKVYDNTVKRMMDELDLFIREFKKLRAESLQSRIKEKLDNYLHKKKLIGSVKVMMLNDDMEIILRKPNGHRIEQSSLSNGEKQMFSSAVLASLVDETQTTFPVFIDSPLQKFDSHHTESILTQFYPNIAEQVVIFPLLRKELTESEYQLIKDRVAKTIIIENKSDGSKFKEINKENLFNS